jgi:hypothetical protein
MARPDAHGYLGRGLQKLGKPGEALKALRAAVRAENEKSGSSSGCHCTRVAMSLVVRVLWKIPNEWREAAAE